ncbi:hypothetical protein ScPMuIL_006827 [Solemya velum]
MLKDTVVPLEGDGQSVHDVVYSRRRREVPRMVRELDALKFGRSSEDEYTRSDKIYQRMRILERLLKYFVGRNGPPVQIMQFVNWDATITINNVFYVVPKSVSEIRSVLVAANAIGLRVRATGAGHTRSPLYPDEGHIMMDMRSVKRHDGKQIEIHPKTTVRNFQTVTVMSGVYQYELNDFLLKNRVTMLSQPINYNETVGGMVAASTHGSTWDAPTWSGFVVEMRLLDSRGRLRRFTKEDHPELMKALMCNLGMMGVMYDITIQVYPAIKVDVRQHFDTVGNLFYNNTKLRDLITGNFLVEMSWYPFSSVTDDEAESFQRTGDVPTSWTVKNDEVWYRTFTVNDTIPEVNLRGPMFLPTGGSISGSNVTGILRGRNAIKIPKSLPAHTQHWLVDAFQVIMPPKRGSETSAAFLLNVDNDFIRPSEAFKFMAERVETQIKTRATSPFNAILPRFFENSDCFLCFGNTNIQLPNDSNHSLVIDFLAPPTQDGFYQTAEAFVNRFKDEKVRPHWAKRHTDIPGIVDILRSTYGENLDNFHQQKILSNVDPCDMFMNDYLLTIFGRQRSRWLC